MILICIFHMTSIVFKARFVNVLLCRREGKLCGKDEGSDPCAEVCSSVSGRLKEETAGVSSSHG